LLKKIKALRDARLRAEHVAFIVQSLLEGVEYHSIGAGVGD
jgi:hypothetical protein